MGPVRRAGVIVMDCECGFGYSIIGPLRVPGLLHIPEQVAAALRQQLVKNLQ